MPSIRRVLSFVHLWTGLILFLPLVLLGLTGSVLVFHDQIDQWSAPHLHAATTGVPRPVSDIVAAARSSAPEGFRPSFYSAPEHDGASARVRFSDPKRQGPGPGGGATVYIDPVTLDVLGVERGGQGGFMRVMHQLHGSLMIPVWGRSIVGWLGIAMCLLGLSGLVIWWPRNGRWKQAFSVKWRATPLRLNRDLHAATGFWSLIVFLVVSFSGVYIAFPAQTANVISTVLPARDLHAPPPKVTPVKGAEPIALQDAIEIAMAAVPSTRLTGAMLPQRSDQAVRIGLARAGDEHGAPMPVVFVDPWTRAVAEIRDPRDFSAGETVLAWQRGLHVGEGLGWTWKILVFLSGLIIPLFAVTGLTMWLLKNRNRRGSAVSVPVRALPDAGE